MPKLTQALPSLRRNKASGQAIVTLSGRDFCLGPWRSKLAKSEYDRVIGEWLAAGRQLPAAANTVETTVTELAAAYLGFEFAAAAMRALLGMHVVFEERGFRRRLGPKHAGVLAMFLSPAVVGRARAGLGLLPGPLATLEKCLKLVFKLRNPPP